MTITNDIAALLKAAGCTSGGPNGDGTYVHAATRDVVAALQASPTPAVGPTALHYLGDGPHSGAAQDPCGCVAYFNTETECKAFMEYVGKLPASSTQHVEFRNPQPYNGD